MRMKQLKISLVINCGLRLVYEFDFWDCVMEQNCERTEAGWDCDVCG